MTRKQLERIVRTWQRRLGLQAWDLVIDWDNTCRKGCDATTWRSDDYDRACVRFDRDDWPGWDARFANLIVVHELMHLILRDIDQVFGSLDGQIGRDVYAVTEKRYDHEAEGLCDRLAHRLVEVGGLVS